MRLQIVGLRSWRTERELNFEGVDLAAVIGPTGAGKSSLLEAIVYALYNASTYDKRGVGSLISSDGKTMSVTLDFEANGKRWRVTRSISRNNYPPSVHKLTCLTSPAEHPMVEGERGVNTAIEATIGLDLDQFLTAVLLPQGRFQTLLLATAGERAGILKGVFRLDELDEIRERASNARRYQIEPIFEARQAERAQLLPDPEATLVEAVTEVDRCTETVSKLAGVKEWHDALVSRAREIEAAATQARQQADALEASARAIPSLETAVGLDAEIAVREDERRSVREGHTSRRDQAQATLDEAGTKGVTVESLATARQILETARKVIPTLDTDEVGHTEAREVGKSQKLSLEEETREHAVQVEQLAGAPDTVSSLKASADQAGSKLIGATDGLRTFRTLQEQATISRSNVVEHEEKLATAAAAAETLKGQAAAGKAAADGAETVLEAVRKEHEASHLAAGLHAGESCPICQRKLPDAFAPPEAPRALKSAQDEAARLRTAADESAAAANRASAGVETLGEQLAAVRTTSGLAEERAFEARALAEELLGSTELGRDDAQLLGTFQQEAATAQVAYEAADRKLALTRGRLDLAAESLRQRGQALAEREQELNRERDRIARERNAQSVALSSLPEEYKPAGTTPDALATATERCSVRLTELQELHEHVRNANTDIAKVDAEIVALAKERTETVDNPRREATAHARQIAAKVLELHPPAEVSKQPADNATINGHATWVGEVVAQALELAGKMHAKASEDEDKRAEATRGAEAAIKAADQLVEAEITTASALDSQLNSWRARLLAAEKDRDKAVDQVPKAALLDTEINKLRTRREALEEVTRLLGDGHFIKWLVGRRQQLLLVVASEIFAGMTGGRYRFAADFTVIDGRTGIARHPRTLSGGEGFMASLALALGMAEIAARSGGRIGSLYLDEGFGALDPNALDEAITALELRARAGQMILIVSHVPAVAQRIDHVLQVRPDPTGSTAEWLHDEDRESLLVEAASAEV